MVEVTGMNIRNKMLVILLGIVIVSSMLLTSVAMTSLGDAKDTAVGESKEALIEQELVNLEQMALDKALQNDAFFQMVADSTMAVSHFVSGLEGMDNTREVTAFTYGGTFGVTNLNGALDGSIGWNFSVDGHAGVPFGRVNGMFDGDLNGTVFGMFFGDMDADVDMIFTGTIDAWLNGTLNGTAVDQAYDTKMTDADFVGHINGTLLRTDTQTTVVDLLDEPIGALVNGTIDGTVNGTFTNWVHATFVGNVDSLFFCNLTGTFTGTEDYTMTLVQEFVRSITLTHPQIASVYYGSENGDMPAYPAEAAFPQKYDPRIRGWYKQAVEEQDGAWTSIYEDAWGGGLMISGPTPVYDDQGTLLGVAGVDVVIQSIIDNTVAITVGGAGYAFLIDQDAHIVARPDYTVGSSEWDESFQYTDLLTADNENDELRTLVSAMVAGGNDVMKVNFDDGEKYIAYAPINTTGWSLGIVIPVSHVTDPADETGESIESSVSEMQMSLGMVVIIIIIISAVIVIWGASTLTDPIVELTRVADKVSHGDMNVKVNVSSGDEIGTLAQSFTRMVNSLQIAMKQLESMMGEDTPDEKPDKKPSGKKDEEKPSDKEDVDEDPSEDEGDEEGTSEEDDDEGEEK